MSPEKTTKCFSYLEATINTLNPNTIADEYSKASMNAAKAYVH